MKSVERKASQIQARLMFEVLRAIREMSFAEASRKSGVSAITISRWCRTKEHGGVRFPRVDTLLKIAVSVGLDVHIVPAGQGEFRKWNKQPERTVHG